MVSDANKRAANRVRSTIWRNNHPLEAAATRKRTTARRKAERAERIAPVLLAQGGHCAICKANKPGPKGWQEDHDHVTGVRRGILCLHCNVGLGHFKDSAALIH